MRGATKDFNITNISSLVLPAPPVPRRAPQGQSMPTITSEALTTA